MAAGYVDSDEIAELPGRSHVKVLRFSRIKCDAMPPFDECDRLLAIDMHSVHLVYANDQGDGDPEFWRCLRVIAECDSLQGLNLHNTTVTDRCLQVLARMPNLIHLDVSTNPITDDGPVYFTTMSSLKKLNLADTQVTENGIRKLRAALPDCEIAWDGTFMEQWHRIQATLPAEL
jgi:hypothetical protein